MIEYIDIVKFDNSFHGTGWYTAESYSTDNEEVFYKWMKSGGKCQVSLLASNKGSCIVECDIMSVLSDEVLGYLEIEVDQKPVHWAAKRAEGNGVRLQFALPIKLDLTPCEICFSVSKEFFASEQDLRALSLAFREISVREMVFADCMDLLEVEL